MIEPISHHPYAQFLNDLKSRVILSRNRAAFSVNKELILLYHHIGTEILKQEKMSLSGHSIIKTLSKDLLASFPDMKGFGTANLYNMRRFAELYKDVNDFQQLVGNLPWGHHIALMERTNDEKERLFYMEKCLEYGWSRSILLHQIESGLFLREGKAITNFEQRLPSPYSELAQKTLKDPYIFDFLSLGKESQEREIETSLILHMEKFLMELGSGFAFVGRQYHVQI